MSRFLFLSIAMLVLGACASTEPEGPAPGDSAGGDAPAESEMPSDPDAPADPPPAPWRQFTLGGDEVPDVYLQAWRESDNRASCALIAPDALGDEGEAATPRRAQFAGGWAVAYDLPQIRSAFGVAGTGVSDTSSTYDEWPFQRRWADGSTAGYGPEGGRGPNQLAYLRISGQGCLYNVWSRLSVEHLEFLLEHVRFVEAQ